MAGLLDFLRGDRTPMEVLRDGDMGRPAQMAPMAAPSPARSQQGQGGGGGLGGIMPNIGLALMMLDPWGRNNQAAGMVMRGMAQNRQDAKDAQNRNQTVDYLVGQGMSPEEARIVASDTGMLRQWFGERRPNPDAELDRQYKQMQIDNIKSQIHERNNPTARNTYGNSPIWGKNDQGEWVVMQPSSAGGIVPAETPDGIKLVPPGISHVDTGTNHVYVDRAGTPTSTVEKDIAGAEAEKALGKARGEAQFDLPRAELNARQTTKMIDDLLAHPGRETATGKSSVLDPRNYMAGSDATNFRALLEQAQGRTFLEAYTMLKGGGQITEIEGAKAEAAIARLKTAQSDEAFKTALEDFKQAVNDGLEKMRSQAGVAPSSGDAVAAEDPLGIR